jgi:hypothetical protein
MWNESGAKHEVDVPLLPLAAVFGAATTRPMTIHSVKKRARKVDCTTCAAHS